MIHAISDEVIVHSQRAADAIGLFTYVDACRDATCSTISLGSSLSAIMPEYSPSTIILLLLRYYDADSRQIAIGRQAGVLINYRRQPKKMRR